MPIAYHCSLQLDEKRPSLPIQNPAKARYINRLGVFKLGCIGSKLIRGTEITVKPGYMSEQRFIANGSNVKQWQRRNEKTR
ncbi:hypothetical protein PCIT_a3482 [Pseudoalteromonas citrea]|uniref:Uncharacterized protein n=3 Tax=Pseudoalteromonas TaxID=53246 RepID=A0AAD4AFR2_9GAMM|nr:hypothetical protein PCIT_b0804 [Pseudoalteromonas citrea]KAF7764930.1 hypothetical protein PCIT_b1035 [Pseudoalteromonas citrea]KAF7765038.1 hypothetical protein PCIT_b1171 [Pseudoalteromonas citrea]KAF7768949.1 hypothetical protein PCIT_a3482 [Pseudoalteromonas citrea]